MTASCRIGEGAPGPTENRANGVADYAPPSTIALVGRQRLRRLARRRSRSIATNPAWPSLQAASTRRAGLLGGLDATVGWMGDTGSSSPRPATVVEGGIVSIPADAAGAAPAAHQLRSFVQLGGAQAGHHRPRRGLQRHDHHDRRPRLAAGSRRHWPAPRRRHAADRPATCPTGHVEIAYAATDEVVVIGSGRRTSSSTCSTPARAPRSPTTPAIRASSAASGPRTPASPSSTSPPIRGLVEGPCPAATRPGAAEYEESVKPFLDPFDAFVAAASVGGDVDQPHMLITVK